MKMRFSSNCMQKKNGLRRSSARIRVAFPAVATHADQLVEVRGQFEAVLGRQITLEHLESFEMKLDHSVAAAADEVIVMLLAEGGFVSTSFARKHGRLYDSGFHQQRQGAVHRRARGIDALRLHVMGQVLYAEVAYPRECGSNYRFSHVGDPKGTAVQEVSESVDGLFHGRFNDRRTLATSLYQGPYYCMGRSSVKQVKSGQVGMQVRFASMSFSAVPLAQRGACGIESRFPPSTRPRRDAALPRTAHRYRW